MDSAQRTAAKVVGMAHLLALPIALFAELYVLRQLVAPSGH